MRLVENESDDRTTERVAQMSDRRGIETQPGQKQQQQFWQQRYPQELAIARPAGNNVGPDERAVSVAAGAIVGLLGLSRGTLPGLLCAGIGSMLVYRGVTGHCSVYERLGLDTTGPVTSPSGQPLSSGLQISCAITINKPAAELYRFWRNFENLPRFMEYLESVKVLDDRRSHWTVKTPRALGGTVQWDAEVTRDDPDELIAWRSLPGSTIDTAGQVRFQKALGDRGTEVHVWMNYSPPAGTLGHWTASLLGQNPKRMVREALHNFQRIMEIGEVLTIDGQPHGTCTGRGKPYRESSWKPLFM